MLFEHVVSNHNNQEWWLDLKSNILRKNKTDTCTDKLLNNGALLQQNIHTKEHYRLKSGLQTTFKTINFEVQKEDISFLSQELVYRKCQAKK